MAREEYYLQCTMVCKLGTKGTEKRTTSWIPEKGAVVGKQLKLQDPITNQWMIGLWTVESVGTMRKSKKDIQERIRLARKYRQATDI